MKNKRKYLMLLPLLIFGLGSCGSKTNDENKGANEDTSIAHVEEKKRYNIALTLENYTKYIEIRYMFGESSTSYYFQGALSYAFYDNVIIKAHSSSNGDYSIKLSVGSYASYYSISTRFSETPSIIGIEGNVIYWI